MEGVYPIMIDGTLAGKLTVTAQGARTVFSAECRLLPGIIRISVYGGGKEGYLGVLVPEDGKLTLKKTMSPVQLRDFPAVIDCADRAGLAAQYCEEAVPESAEAEPTPEEAAPQIVPEPQTPELPADEAEDDLYWYSSPDGALVRFDGERNLIALPAGDPRIPEGRGGQRRTVDGREYMVFRTKNGRLEE